MIKINMVEIVGWKHAIRGMRNPLNSWDKSDSKLCYESNECVGCYYHDPDTEDCSFTLASQIGEGIILGQNDKNLAMRLASGGPVHAKYRRMIVVYLDVNAPLYWWKEFDTYKVGTVINSCSTMHKIHAKEFTLKDFSHEHLIKDEPIPTRTYSPFDMLNATIDNLNHLRDLYNQTKDKKYWDQMIQLLPTSYHQKRTVMLNYEVLHNIYISRKNHKLNEWRDFCSWIEGLPYSELITVKEGEESHDSY